MTFINLLTDKEDYLSSITRKINLSDRPLFLYGAGKYAEILYQLFTKNGVVFKEIVVSKLSEDQDKYFNEQPVKEFDTVAQEYTSFNVLAGISIETVLDKLKIHPHVKEIFFYDVTFRYCNDYVSENHFDRNFLFNNDSELTLLYNDLEDDLSRNTMIAFYNQQLTGNCKYVEEVFDINKYFIDQIKLQDGEVFVDCGAYTGDSVNSFIQAARGIKYKNILALEPDKRNFMELVKNHSTVPCLTCINKGSWNEKTILRFSNTGKTTSMFSQDGNIQIEVDTIDNILNGQEATYIKMDVEGAELFSLVGAEKTIRKYKPKLAICVYHKYDDLLTIPKYINSLNKEYKFYLRAHDKPYFFDLILYAI